MEKKKRTRPTVAEHKQLLEDFKAMGAEVERLGLELSKTSSELLRAKRHCEEIGMDKAFAHDMLSQHRSLDRDILSLLSERAGIRGFGTVEGVRRMCQNREAEKLKHQKDSAARALGEQRMAILYALKSHIIERQQEQLDDMAAHAAHGASLMRIMDASMEQALAEIEELSIALPTTLRKR